MKKCCFCGEGLPDTTAICPWCGRRQQQQQKSPVEPRELLSESPYVKVWLDFSMEGGSLIKMETDFSGLVEGLERFQDFAADIPWEMEIVHVTLSQEELIEWDARDEQVREMFRHSQRELGRNAAEARHLFVVVESDDETILSLCKFDKNGYWQFIDLEGQMRIPGYLELFRAKDDDH
jgi:hypothetical protein